MPKYYVETGTLQEVVMADNPTEACRMAIRSVSRLFLKTGDGDVVLGESFIVNERGFPSNRSPFTIDTFNDTLVSTSTIIEDYENGL